MNHIKTIEEFRICHKRLKGGETAIQRLEDRDKESKGRAPHKPAFLILNATNRNTKTIIIYIGPYNP